MATIESKIDEIVEGHAECRWLDAGELREYLEVVATDQKNIDHSEEHLAWILQEYFKWRESNNPKVSFGEWISVSMEE